MERLQSREWFDADAVVISDFIAQRLPDDVTSKVKELQRVHQHRFHAVAMSAHGKPGIMRIFDHIWRFDTGCEAACSDAGGDKLLQQRRDVLANSSWPYTTLNLADMRQLQQQHGQTRLADTAADGLRHFTAQQRLMPPSSRRSSSPNSAN